MLGRGFLHNGDVPFEERPLLAVVFKVLMIFLLVVVADSLDAFV